MDILTITTWDAAGEQFNGYQIHRELIRRGDQSCMAVMLKEKDDPNIHVLGNRLTQYLDNGILKRIENIFGIRCLLPLSGWLLFLKNYYRKCEIIHLQLIHAESFMSLFLIPIISRRRKVIWTLHDPWIMTGHCIYPLDCKKWREGCGECPILDSPFPVRRDSTRFFWNLKRWFLRHSNIEIVVASDWMRRMVSESPIVSHLPCHVIPFGVHTLDPQKIKSDEFRKKYSIPPEAYIIAFRYKGPKDQFKGGPFIEDALKKIQLDRPVSLVVFDGTGDMEELKQRYQVIQLGWTTTHDPILEALRAADLFLMPSTAEAFGVMAIESMACGTPLIVFEGTALPEVIHAPEGGIAVPKDASALAAAIERILIDTELYEKLTENGRKIVKENYSLESYIKNHIDLYSKIIYK